MPGYSRLEIMAAFGIGDRARLPWQTGVYEVRDAGADLLAFTSIRAAVAFITDHPLPRLCHQSQADSLGEPVGHQG